MDSRYSKITVFYYPISFDKNKVLQNSVFLFKVKIAVQRSLLKVNHPPYHLISKLLYYPSHHPATPPAAMSFRIGGSKGSRQLRFFGGPSK